MSRQILIAIAMATPALAVHAQFGGEQRDMANREIYSAYMIQVGGENLSPEVIKLVAEHLKLRLPDWGQLPSASVEVEFLGHQLDRASILGLAVWIPKAANFTSEREKRDLWNVARAQLEKELQRVIEMGFEAQQVRLERELAEQQAQRSQVEERAAKLTEELSLLEAETAGADRDTLAKAIAEAVSNQRGLQLEDAGLRAHRQAVEERIDELRKIAAKEGDPIVNELERIVEIREQAREHLEHANKSAPNAVSEAQFLEVDGSIAEAKIEMLRARREAEDRSSGGALRELTKELSKLLVESAKIEGQRKQLEQIIAELREQVRDTAQAAARLAPLQDEMHVIRNQSQHIENEIGNLRRGLDSLTEPAISLQPLVQDQAAPAGEPEASAPGDSGSAAAAPDRE